MFSLVLLLLIKTTVYYAENYHKLATDLRM